MAEQYFQQPSVMSAQQHFSQAPSAQIPRSTFNRSHAYKSTFNASDLVPFFVDEVLPGDSFDINATLFARLATPLKPVMDNMYLDAQFFFIPNRLVWDHWVNFCGERVNPDDDPSIYSIPYIDLDRTLITDTSVANYFGIPTGTGRAVVNALPFRAYALVYNEWYRDQNLQQSTLPNTGDGPDTAWDGMPCYKRNKRHDYFTSCLPWPQKGNPVLIPIAPRAPITGLGIDFNTTTAVSANIPVRETDWQTGDPATTYAQGVYANTTGVLGIQVSQPGGTGPITPQIYAELAEATSVTINDLRLAFQIQKFLERDARGGTRYIEKIFSHFGVKSDDARLQRPELLSTSSTRINISPVAATAPLPDAPQANLAAFGTALNRTGFNKSFTEHGFVIGILSVRADLTYQQGIERFWSRRTINEYYWPTFAHLGEQAVLNKEIYLQGTAADDEVFGYQERYAEYRYKPSRITGLFSSLQSASLDVWHLSQEFSALPLLNDSFIKEDVPIDRIIAVPGEPHFLLDAWINFNATRPMPVYSVPGLIDHF